MCANRVVRRRVAPPMPSRTGHFPHGGENVESWVPRLLWTLLVLWCLLAAFALSPWGESVAWLVPRVTPVE